MKGKGAACSEEDRGTIEHVDATIRMAAVLKSLLHKSAPRFAGAAASQSGGPPSRNADGSAPDSISAEAQQSGGSAVTDAAAAAAAASALCESISAELSGPQVTTTTEEDAALLVQLQQLQQSEPGQHNSSSSEQLHGAALELVANNSKDHQPTAHPSDAPGDHNECVGKEMVQDNCHTNRKLLLAVSLRLECKLQLQTAVQLLSQYQQLLSSSCKALT